MDMSDGDLSSSSSSTTPPRQNPTRSPQSQPTGGGTNIETNEEESVRFQIELEFVQSLANPNYLNYLAQRGYFKQPSFLNYLKYLMYWKEPEYCKHLVYPQCLRLLEMLQHEKFLAELVNSQCTRFVEDQLVRVWLQYKKKHDWVRFDPTKVPENIKNLFSPDDRVELSASHTENDPFSAVSFIKNEKF